jgi:hypothetical protein
VQDKVYSVDGDVDTFDFQHFHLKKLSEPRSNFPTNFTKVNVPASGTTVATAHAGSRKETSDAQDLYPRSGAGDELRARGKAGRAVG